MDGVIWAWEILRVVSLPTIRWSAPLFPAYTTIWCYLVRWLSPLRARVPIVMNAADRRLVIEGAKNSLAERART
jgi:hypothetical protein